MRGIKLKPSILDEANLKDFASMLVRDSEEVTETTVSKLLEDNLLASFPVTATLVNA